MKKYNRNKKRRTSKVKRGKNLIKSLIKTRRNMKRREYKIKEQVKMSNGKYKTMDTKVVFTMTREEALKTGFIREV